MKLNARMISIALSTLARTACGTGQEPIGPAAAVDAQRFPRTMPAQLAIDCGRLCEKRRVCGPRREVPDCAETCRQRLQHYRPEAVNNFADCIVQSPCFVNEAVCLREVTPTAAHLNYAAACRAKRTACGGAEEQIAASCDVTVHDVAVRYLLYSAEVMKGATACLEGPCPAGHCTLAIPAYPLTPP